MKRPTYDNMSAMCSAHHLMSQTKHGEQAREPEGATHPVAVCRVLTLLLSLCAADKNQGDKAGEAADKFKEVAQAYAILSDPDKKRKYDMGGFESLNPSDLEVQVDLSSLGELRKGSRVAGQLC